MPAGQLQKRVTKVPEIRRGDKVVVLTGKDAGKRGTVERVDHATSRARRSPSRSTAPSGSRCRPLSTTAVVVEGLNIAKRHTKAAPEPEHDRPHAEDDPGRHPRSGPADADQQGHARLHPLRQADPDRPQDARQRSPRPRLPSLRRAGGGAARDQRGSASATRPRSCRRSRSSSSTATRWTCRRLSKIVVNIGLGEALSNAKALDAAVGDLTMITGQKPIVTKAKRSIAQFRLRTGNTIGAKVTLRGERMWDFLERLDDPRPAPDPRLPRRPRQVVRRARQLQPRASRAARVPRDRIRQGGPSARAGDQHRDDGQDRRGEQASARAPRHALLVSRPVLRRAPGAGEELDGQEVDDRQGEARARSSRFAATAAASCAGVRAPTCGGSPCAGSASGSVRWSASCPA